MALCLATIGLRAADLLTPDERAWLTAHGPLRYAPDPHFAPFEFFRDDGQLAGISPEILALVAHHLGTTIKPVHYVAWSDALAGFERGEADFLATLTRTPERERFLDFSTAYLSVPNVLIVNGRSQAINGFADLTGRTVGVVRNSGAHSWLLHHHPEVTIRPQVNPTEGLRKVSLGQLDAMLEVLPVAGFVIAEYSYTNLRVLPHVEFTIPQHLGVHKGDARLLAILEKGLASVPMQERLQIFARWTGEDPAERERIVPRWVWRTAAALLLVLAGVAAWIVSLRRLVAARTRELRASEEQFRRLLEELPVAAAWADAADRVEFVNREFTRLFGYVREDLPTVARWFELAYRDPAYRAEIVAEWEARFDRVRATGRASEPLEVRMTTQDGRLRSVVIVGCFVGGKTLAVFEDVTDRMRLEQQLRQAQKMEAIGQLAGGVAHDFNNLLTVIQGHSSLALSGGALPAELRESLEQIQQASGRAANLTRQLLTFSRQQAFRPRALDLRSSLESTSRMLTRLLDETVTLVCQPDPQPVRVLADDGMIEQVIVNLAVNARDAMPAGGRLTIGVANAVVAPEEAGVRHTAAYAGRFALLTVSDTGTGLSPEAAHHLFEPFFTTKDVGRGTGLGLATVYGIVQLHRGWIEVTSAPGAGTTFRLFFPALEGAAEEAEPAPAHRPVPGRETVLIVEDEPTVRMLAHVCLQRAGYRVLEAADAVAALAVWRQNTGSIDALLTDMVMPGGMSGLELAHEIWREQPALPVILASGYSRQNESGEAADPRIEHLAKPFDVVTLTQTVRAALDRRIPPAA